VGRILGLAFVALLITFGVWLYYFLVAAGVFQDIKPRALEACRTVNGVVGVEDLAIDTELGVAYLAGYDRRAVVKGAVVRGAVWVYDLNAPDASPIDMTAAALPDGFWPHGISLYRGADGKRTLFVINHANGKHSVEVFDVVGATLTHRRTVTGAALVAPNDLVGVGGDAFYVTNDHGYPTGWARTAED
jgi:arylesterase/paraoxonase